MELDERGRIRTDAEWQTNVPGIYAIGDVIAGPMLAHKAEQEAVAAVERMAGKAGRVNDTIPWVIYTAPEVAAVGLTEAEAKEGHEVSVGVSVSGQRRGGGRGARGRLGQGHRRQGNRPGAGRANSIGQRLELIAEAVLLMEFDGSAEDLARTIRGATMSEGLHERRSHGHGRAAACMLGKATHWKGTILILLKYPSLSGGMNVPAPLFYLAHLAKQAQKRVMTGAFFVWFKLISRPGQGQWLPEGGPSAAAGFWA